MCAGRAGLVPNPMRSHAEKQTFISQSPRQHEVKWPSNGMGMGSAPVSWKPSPVPLWQLAWSSSHSSTRSPLGVVGPAVGAAMRSKDYCLMPLKCILKPLPVESANTFAENFNLWQEGQEHGLPLLSAN